MDAVPFRQFLCSKVYASKEELSDVVGRNEGAEDFCQWVLALRDDWRSRRSVGEYIQQRHRRKLRFLPSFGFVLLSKTYLTFGLSYIKDVVPKPRGQQLSNLLVVYSIDVWLTWVGVRIVYRPLLFLSAQDQWPSRPIAGLCKWGTTATSKLLSILRTILLQCDKVDDHWRAHEKTPKMFSLVCNTCMMCTPHTSQCTPTSHETCKQWRAWYYQLFYASNFLTTEEKGFLEFMFTLLTREQHEAFVSHFPFAPLAYSPTLSLAEFMLHVVVTHCCFVAPGLGIFLQLEVFW